MTIKQTLFLLAAALLQACTAGDAHTFKIETPFGSMTAKLYDDTPLHSHNFAKLAEAGKYDSLLFHRVIQGFMVQGGDPESFHAPRHKQLGGNEIGQPIDAEIDYPAHFHKRGAIAAARKPDSHNPEKKSSGSQFYIVHGKTYTDFELDEMETIHNNARRQKIFYEVQPFYEDSLKYYQDNGMAVELSELQIKVMGKVEEMLDAQGRFSFPPEVREAYKTVGGTPQLDGNYTVFGEIIDGFDVLDSIAAARTFVPGNRPVKDIWMVIKPVE